MLKIIKSLTKILYCIIFLAIILGGILNLSDILKYFHITGTLNTFLTYTLVIYAFGMFFYDLDKQNKIKEKYK